MSTTFAIGDIHGCLEPLEELVLKCIAYDPEPKFVFLGDYVDRGPESRGVIEFLIALAHSYECVFLRGNHEDMFMNDPELCWMNGGRQTMASYGADVRTINTVIELSGAIRSFVPESHWEFFHNTKMYHKDALRTYVHAGMLRNGDIETQGSRTLLWVRGPFLNDESIEGGYIVHGHTPMENGNLPNEKPNRVNLDTGGCFGGRLTAGIFNDKDAELFDFIQVESPKEGPYAED